jgi:hypothetical protein
MFVIPLLIVGALACLMRGRDRSSRPTPAVTALALPAGPSPMPSFGAPAQVPVLTSGVPSPIAVMGEFLRRGQRPPPLVITCAIAEAESIGRSDVAETIVRAFILPVVLAAEEAHAASVAQGVAQVHAQMAATMSPAPYFPSQSAPTMMPAPSMMAMPMAPYAPPYAPAMAYPEPHDRAPAYPHDSPPSYPTPPTSLISPSYLGPPPGMPIDVLPDPTPAPASLPEPAMRPYRTAPSSSDQGQESSSGRGGSTPRGNATTITVSGKSSPIQGVDTASWGSFVNRVSRELPTFMAARHIGQFRQRRDRLRELDIDERTLVDSPDAQLAAFEADMADAYYHADRSGALDDYVGHVVDVPVDGQPRAIRVTKSGLLGVIQAAGLDGAVGWFEDPNDRLRFPHTTHAFLRTNGVF